MTDVVLHARGGRRSAVVSLLATGSSVFDPVPFLTFRHRRVARGAEHQHRRHRDLQRPQPGRGRARQLQRAVHSRTIALVWHAVGFATLLAIDIGGSRTGDQRSIGVAVIIFTKMFLLPV